MYNINIKCKATEMFLQILNYAKNNFVYLRTGIGKYILIHAPLM